MPGAEMAIGRDPMDVLRGLIGEWKNGRDGREVARVASAALDEVCARVSRVRQRCPGVEIDLGEDVHALIRLRNRQQRRPPLSGGLLRAATL